MCTPTLGTVGIGISPPPNIKLEVKGSISVFDGNGNTSLFFGREHLIPPHAVNSASNYGEWGIQYVPANAISSGSPSGLNFWKPFGSDGSQAVNNFLFLRDDGNVGIGTTLNDNPNNYKLAVNGLIGAKELKIEINSTTWPDFVFNKSYSLLSLNELEQYLNKNKHLPNIPSTEDIKKDNGILVGDMQAKLLQKVEELTLYIIEQNKKIIEQNKRIEALEKTSPK
jgi:hypothetical protein